MQIKVGSLLWLKGFSADTGMKNMRGDDTLQPIKRKPEEEVVYWRPLTRCEVHSMPFVLEMTEKSGYAEISCGRGGVFGAAVGCQRGLVVFCFSLQWSFLVCVTQKEGDDDMGLKQH